MREIGCSRATLARWSRTGRIHPVRFRANEIGFRQSEVERLRKERARVADDAPKLF